MQHRGTAVDTHVVVHKLLEAATHMGGMIEDIGASSSPVLSWYRSN